MKKSAKPNENDQSSVETENNKDPEQEETANQSGNKAGSSVPAAHNVHSFTGSRLINLYLFCV